MSPLPHHGSLWTYEDHIIAFNLYCQLPFGKLHQGNQRIIDLARLLGRTPDSVAMKLSNFARLDPSLKARGVGGLSRGAKGEQTVWNEFAEQPETLAFRSEQLLAEKLGKCVEETAGIDQLDLPPAGVERDAIVRVRVNQSFFRRRVISAYDFKCCVTGLAFPELLVASHITPWALDIENRLNPRNGLCLNALHDKAFDRGLMWIDDEFRIRFADRLSGNNRESTESLQWVTQFAGQSLRLPRNLVPDMQLLRKHRELWQR